MNETDISNIRAAIVEQLNALPAESAHSLTYGGFMAICNNAYEEAKNATQD